MIIINNDLISMKRAKSQFGAHLTFTCAHTDYLLFFLCHCETIETQTFSFYVILFLFLLKKISYCIKLSLGYTLTMILFIVL